jgi:hypothetical protein
LKRFSTCVGVLVLLLPLASAQETRVYREGGSWAQEITGSLAAAKNLHVKVDVGSVHVQGGSQSDISYSIHNRVNTSPEEKARREFESYKINAYVRGDTAWIVAEWQGGGSRKFSSNFEVHVPRGTEWVKLETDGGSVETTGIAGRVDAASGGGSIRLDDIGGAVKAETGGGGIDVGTVGGELSLRTGGGSIHVVSAKGKINAESGGGSVHVVTALQNSVLETGGGSIKVERCAGRLRATTGGGSIDLGDVDGPAELETGGGSIRLGSAKGPVRAETGGGSIELNGVPAARAETGAGGITARFLSSGSDRTDSMLETSAGDITVFLPSNLNLTIRASIDMANGHNIRSEFSEIRVTGDGCQYCPKTVTAEGNLNGGGPVLKVRTTTGDIAFRRTGQ